MSDVLDVLDTNDAFYRIMRAGDYDSMDALWASERQVTCTHPGWTTLTGRRAVMRSWRLLLTQQEPPEIWPDEPQAVVTGETAMVLCIERLGGAELMATNTFVRELGAWRVLSHQAAKMPAERAT